MKRIIYEFDLEICAVNGSEILWPSYKTVTLQMRATGNYKPEFTPRCARGEYIPDGPPEPAGVEDIELEVWGKSVSDTKRWLIAGPLAELVDLEKLEAEMIKAEEER
jgi:hypothetical protein